MAAAKQWRSSGAVGALRLCSKQPAVNVVGHQGRWVRYCGSLGIQVVAIPAQHLQEQPGLTLMGEPLYARFRATLVEQCTVLPEGFRDIAKVPRYGLVRASRLDLPTWTCQVALKSDLPR